MYILRLPAIGCCLVLLLMPCAFAAEEPAATAGQPATAEPRSLADLGKAEYQAGNHAKAFTYYQNALREISKTGVPGKELLETFGALCLQLKKQDEYIDTMRQLMLLYPSAKPMEELRKYSRGLEPLLTAPDYSKRPRQALPLRDETKQQITLAQQGLLLGNDAGSRLMTEAMLTNENLNSVERAVVWALRGIMYNSEGLPVAAAYAYEQSVLQPDSPDPFLQNAYRELGGIYLQIGKYDLALDRASRSRRDLTTMSIACQASWHLKKQAEAITACEQVLTAAGKQVERVTDELKVLQLLYSETGDRENEMRILKLLLKEAPDRPYKQRLAELKAAGKK